MPRDGDASGRELPFGAALVLDRLREVGRANSMGARQVGDGPGDHQNAVVGPGR
jgi:hypothetical protein